MRKLIVLIAIVVALPIGPAALAHEDPSDIAKDRIDNVRDTYDEAVEDTKDDWKDDRDAITDRDSWPSTSDGGELTNRANEYANERTRLAREYHDDLQAAWGKWADAKREELS